MRLKNILDFLAKKNTSGATLDEFKNEFGDEDMECLKRLIQASIDLGEVKRDGKGRGLRYYGIDYEIVKITSGPKVNHGNFVEGIDVTNCSTVKEKIAEVLNSDFKLVGLHKFQFREKLDSKELNRELYDFIRQGAIDYDVNVAFNFNKQKNLIVSKNSRTVANKLTIGINNDGHWMLTKIFFECPDRPEVLTFVDYRDFEKCLKTLLSK